MKHAILVVSILCLSVSCLKDNQVGIDDQEMSVEQYVALLKSEKFDFYQMPVFEISDIPELLKYTRDEQEQVFYTINDLHSSVPSQRLTTTVGMVILWTIEGTRLDVDYPSVAPIVWDGETHRILEMNEVADLYDAWWEKNKEKSASELKKKSPFERTHFFWL